jgi:plastocyanin
MTGRALWAAAGLALVAALTAGACGGGGGGGTPTSPSPGGGGTGGGGGTATNTITIGSDGRVSPANITVALGSRVTFVNNSNRAHDMSSDPHPEHTDCPEINVGNIVPGQSRQTENLNRARTCGFHDHNENSNTALQGTIRIQ